jgi:WD40 repeat protein
VSFSGNVEDQQVGNAWTPAGHLVSLALSGDLYYLDPRTDKPVRTIYGHQKSITAFAVQKETLYTASYDGRVCAWSSTSGEATLVSGKGHTNQVSFLTTTPSHVLSAGMDDTVRAIDVGTNTFECVP